jgi:hypothetical protein
VALQVSSHPCAVLISSYTEAEQRSQPALCWSETALGRSASHELPRRTSANPDDGFAVAQTAGFRCSLRSQLAPFVDAPRRAPENTDPTGGACAAGVGCRG